MEKAYAYWLHAALERNNRLIEQLLMEIGTPEKIYEISEKELAYYLTEAQMNKFRSVKKNWHVKNAFQRLQEQDIRFVTKEEKHYPEKLKEIPDAPYGIYVKGKLPREDKRSVAIIGARDCSEYGRYLAREFGMALAKQGIQVISGLARGIDGISQKGAVDGDGDTFAVLGSGVDICYPESNRELYDKIKTTGGILSEYQPGTIPIPRNFPPRNRIISGLSDAVLVIEAREKSGTMITVDMALEQGREVYVIPGRITDSLSAGCNRLICQGAEIVLQIDEFIDTIFRLGEPQLIPKRKRSEIMEQLDMAHLLSQRIEHKTGRLIMEVMDFTPQSVDAILEKIREKKEENSRNDSITIPEIMQQLIDLQMRGLIMQTGGQYYLHMETKGKK